jgi:hypothetical protein
MSEIEPNEISDFIISGNIGEGHLAAAVNRFVIFNELYEQRFGKSPDATLDIDQLADALEIDLKEHPLERYFDDR